MSNIPTQSPGGGAELPQAQDRPDRAAGAAGKPDAAPQAGADGGARGAAPTEDRVARQAVRAAGWITLNDPDL